MSKKYLVRENVPSIILHSGFILSILIILSALASAITSLPMTLVTYKQFYMARETAMYGLVVALEALVGFFLTSRVVSKNSTEK
jgi:hypothetical protein